MDIVYNTSKINWIEESQKTLGEIKRKFVGDFKKQFGKYVNR